jgi:hypothetical protein
LSARRRTGPLLRQSVRRRKSNGESLGDLGFTWGAVRSLDALFDRARESRFGYE